MLRPIVNGKGKTLLLIISLAFNLGACLAVAVQGYGGPEPKRERDRGWRHRESLTKRLGLSPEQEEVLAASREEFFRESRHFQVLTAEVLPKVLAQRDRSEGPPVWAWSAGCSTGEEPYSIAMSYAEVAGDPERYDFRILATDINGKVLRAAHINISEDPSKPQRMRFEGPLQSRAIGQSGNGQSGETKSASRGPKRTGIHFKRIGLGRFDYIKNATHMTLSEGR